MAFYLVFKDTLFHEITQAELTDSDLAVLMIENGESTLFFNESITLIDKLTAQRQVNSIVKTGFLLKDNQRVGTNTKLKIVTGSVPSNKSESKLVEETKTTVAEIVPKLVEPAKAAEPAEPAPVEETKPTNEKETYERPIRFEVEKETGEAVDDGDTGFASEKLLETKLGEKEKDFSISSVLREEKEKALENTEKPAPPRSYDEVVHYFWQELFGQVYESWDSLPTKAKDDFFATLNITTLSDEEVQELFAIRHENNIEAFKQKLNDFQKKKSA